MWSGCTKMCYLSTFSCDQTEMGYLWLDSCVQKSTSLIHAQISELPELCDAQFVTMHDEGGNLQWSGGWTYKNKAGKCERLPLSRKRRFSVWKIFHLNLNDNIWFSSLSPAAPHFFFIRKAAITASNKKIINKLAAHMWRGNLIRNSWAERERKI